MPYIVRTEKIERLEAMMGEINDMAEEDYDWLDELDDLYIQAHDDIERIIKFMWRKLKEQEAKSLEAWRKSNGS